MILGELRNGVWNKVRQLFKTRLGNPAKIEAVLVGAYKERTSEKRAASILIAGKYAESIALRSDYLHGDFPGFRKCSGCPSEKPILYL